MSTLLLLYCDLRTFYSVLQSVTLRPQKNIEQLPKTLLPKSFPFPNKTQTHTRRTFHRQPKHTSHGHRITPLVKPVFPNTTVRSGVYVECVHSMQRFQHTYARVCRKRGVFTMTGKRGNLREETFPVQSSTMLIFIDDMFVQKATTNIFFSY